jgi:hypothetical protein
MFIDKDTLKCVNIYTPYKGFSILDTPEIRDRVGVVEIADPPRPDDYSEETYYRTEQEDYPYVIYTRKSDEQIEEIRRNKIFTEISAIEDRQIKETARMSRERTLLDAEKLALESFGLDPDQLYAMASLPDAPTAAITYKKLKDLDNDVKRLRSLLT